MLSDSTGSCSLPDTLVKIVQVMDTDNLFKFRETPQEIFQYIYCQGFTSKLSFLNLWPLMLLYPWLFAWFVYCTLLTLIVAFWSNHYWFNHRTSMRRERTKKRHTKYYLIMLTAFLLIPLSFFLWMSVMSYKGYQDLISESHVRMRNLYENYGKAVDNVLGQNMKRMEKYVSNTPNDLLVQLDKDMPLAVRKSNASATEFLYQNSLLMPILMEEFLDNIEMLMVDFMQLNDYVRHFYRNTTSYFSVNDADLHLQNAIMMEELEYNGKKIALILSVQHMNEVFLEIVRYAGVMHRRHNAMLKAIGMFHALQATHISTAWQNYTIQVEKYHEGMTAALNNGTGSGTSATIRLPEFVVNTELAFCIFVAVLIFFILVFLCCALLARLNSKLLVYIIPLLFGVLALTCIASFFLSLVSVLHFCIGAILYHFGNAIKSGNYTCNPTVAGYCDVKSAFTGFAQHDFTVDRLIQRQESIRAIFIPSSSEYGQLNAEEECKAERVHQLSLEAKSIRSFFSGNDILTKFVDGQGYLNKWYGIAEQFIIQHQLAEHHDELLKCNVDLLSRLAFQQLLAQDTVKSLRQLTSSSRKLSTYLPEHMTELLPKVLQEIYIMRNFYSTTFERLLHDLATNAVQAHDTEMFRFGALTSDLPHCDDVLLAQVGMSPGELMCLQTAVHGFWISSFGILILCFPLVLILMFLAPLYKKLYNRHHVGVTFHDALNSGDVQNDSPPMPPSSTFGKVKKAFKSLFEQTFTALPDLVSKVTASLSMKRNIPDTSSALERPSNVMVRHVPSRRIHGTINTVKKPSKLIVPKESLKSVPCTATVAQKPSNAVMRKESQSTNMSQKQSSVVIRRESHTKNVAQKPSNAVMRKESHSTNIAQTQSNVVMRKESLKSTPESTNAIKTPWNVVLPMSPLKSVSETGSATRKSSKLVIEKALSRSAPETTNTVKVPPNMIIKRVTFKSVPETSDEARLRSNMAMWRASRSSLTRRRRLSPVSTSRSSSEPRTPQTVVAQQVLSRLDGWRVNDVPTRSRNWVSDFEMNTETQPRKKIHYPSRYGI